MTVPSSKDLGRRFFGKVAATSSGISFLIYTAVLWNFHFDPIRRAIPNGALSNFYDLQARALMSGQLDVPSGSLGIEGFIVDERTYMYFPPGPALLRIPVFLFTRSLDGKLTSLSMQLAMIATAVFLVLLIWRVRMIMRPGVVVGRGESMWFGLLILSTLSGSVIFFLASLPWVYHEAYAWSFAMAVGTLYSMVGFLHRPSVRSSAAIFVFLLGSILCRTTTGWAFSAALLLGAALMAFGLLGKEKRPWWKHAAAIAIAPVLIASAINWLKFSHPYMFPLEKQVWTAISSQRRRALTANGGDLVSLRLLPSTLINYLRPNGARLIAMFPWITMPGTAARSYFGGFIDQSYRTGSVPAFMPFLSGLSLVGIVQTARNRTSASIAALRLPLLGAAGILGGILFYGYLAYRYTSEFMPLLVLASIIGLVELVKRSEHWRKFGRVIFCFLLCSAAAWGFIANFGAAIQSERLSLDGLGIVNYLRMQRSISEVPFGNFESFVKKSDSIPALGLADEIRIIGDCKALLVGTGDLYSPWVIAEMSAVRMTVGYPIFGQPERSLLGYFTGPIGEPLYIEFDGGDKYRLSLGSGEQVDSSPWRYAPGDFQIDITVQPDLAMGTYWILEDLEVVLGHPTKVLTENWGNQVSIFVPVGSAASQIVDDAPFCREIQK